MLFGVISGASVMLAELAMDAGLPNGVLNIVHGSNVSFTLKIDCGDFLFILRIVCSLLLTSLISFC